MALNPIISKTAHSTQSDSFARQDETSFLSATPPDSGVFKQCTERDSQLGPTPTFFSSSSSSQANSSFCSDFSTLEGGLLSGGESETKVFLYAHQRGLDNGSREKLLALKMGYAALVLDVLLKMWPAGQRFTERQALAQVQLFGIGRRTLRNALQCAPIRTKVFSTSLFSLAGFERPKRGRPAQAYKLPNAAEVAQRLGIGRTPSDELKPDDLRGLTNYRVALHRELIRRQPRQYTRGWLAGRLGVSKRTVRDYDKRAKITVTPMIAKTELKAIYLADMPEDGKQNLTSRAEWLEWQGKAYPALQVVARRLLQLGGAMIVRQYSNHYQLNI